MDSSVVPTVSNLNEIEPQSCDAQVMSLQFVGRKGNTLQPSLLLGLDALADALASFGRERRQGGLGILFGQVLRCRVEECDLLAVSTAPFTEQQMELQAKTPGEWKWVIEGLGLQPRGLFAARG